MVRMKKMDEMKSEMEGKEGRSERKIIRILFSIKSFLRRI